MPSPHHYPNSPSPQKVYHQYALSPEPQFHPQPIPTTYQPAHNTQPFLNRSTSTPQPPTPSPSLPPIYHPHPSSTFSKNSQNKTRIKLAQASILHNQLQLNKLNKQKQFFTQYLQNSQTLQNNLLNFPYGISHNTLMEKIITQKSVNDYQNEKILLKFQREAEEFKKSKSRMKKDLQERMQQQVGRGKEMGESRGDLRTEREESVSNFQTNVSTSRVEIKGAPGKSGSIQSMFFDGKKLSGESSRLIRETPETYLPRRDRMTIQTQSSFNPPPTPHSSKYQLSTSNKSIQNPEDISSSTSPLPSSKLPLPPRVTTRNLLPITDEGEDGLKLIRKNLFPRKNLKIKPNQKYKPEKGARVDENEDDEEEQEGSSITEIKEVIQDISDIIKSNRSYVSRLHRRVKTDGTREKQREDKESHSPATKGSIKRVQTEGIKEKQEESQEDNEEDKKERVRYSIPKLKLNLQKFKRKRGDNGEGLEQSRKKLMELSQIFQ